MTALQREVLSLVAAASREGRWYRAAHPGQRVTLASLYYRGSLTRRVWRGVFPNAAHEYAIPRSRATQEASRAT